MSIKTVSINTGALPPLLLPLAKAHMRVDWTYDDIFIQSAIGRAISWFERVTGVSVNPASYEWRPTSAEFVTPRRSAVDPATVPVSPVGEGWSVVDGAAVDVTASYQIVTDSVHGVGLYRLEGDYLEGMVVTIASGYADVAAMPAGILDAVLRYTAHLFEHREILIPGSDSGAMSPGWMADVIATYWMPRV